MTGKPKWPTMGNWLALAFWSLAICLIFVDLTEGDPVGIGTDFSPRFAKDLTESVDLTKNTGRKIVVRSAEGVSEPETGGFDRSSAGEDGSSGEHTKRYPVVTVEFERVKTPFIIGLWIFCASIAKIGNIHKANATVMEMTEHCADQTKSRVIA
ncbi:hypothetical protein RUM44_002943 [Polyplax serrata]|uniref:Uncharacterized protein n=1 Tax=Polyplax serrata TaxID=468196 RepID=A0ABR1AYL6_POLSC